ncbi:MAG: polyketide synthase dehydratase domain-containing protein [Planctomycetes bacterium]|nr:polyketide synthase dehydratase domain-containing protein [Planctomycetota bacterium]MBI3832900.1 polyketide synthase dehydratase domain-containing protein [Planctomycetota bacterium]
MRETAVSASLTNALLQQVVLDRRPNEIHFQTEVRSRSTPLLSDHRLFDVPVLPAAAYLDAALDAAQQLTGLYGVAVADVNFHDFLALPTEESRIFRVRVRRVKQETAAFDVESAAIPTNNESEWRKHAEGIVEHESSPIGVSFLEQMKRDSAGGRPGTHSSEEDFYARANSGPFRWGESLRVVRSVWREKGTIGYELRLDDKSPHSTDENRFHPALLDGCLQVAAMEFSNGSDSNRAAIPTRIDRIRFSGKCPQRVLVNCRPHVPSDHSDERIADFSVADDSGYGVATLEGVHFRTVTRDSFRSKAAFRLPARDARPSPRSGASRSVTPTTLSRRIEAAPPAQRLPLLTNFVEQNVVELLKLKTAAHADLQRGFFSIGLDSLLAIELQFRIQQALGFTLPPGAGLMFQTIDELSRYLLRDVLALSEQTEASV